MVHTASTMAPFFAKGLLTLGFLFLAFPCTGLDRGAYARSLEAEGDWYRAIGQWKEIRFEAADPLVYWAASQSILSDLWAAEQYGAGLTEATQLGKLSAGTPELRAELLTWSGLFHYRLNRFPAAEFSLTQAGSPLYLGLLYARTGRTEEAKQLWSGLNLPDPTASEGETRSPVLAAVASFLVPGLGQAYTGHWFDGAQAAAFVGFFGTAAAGAYLYDSKNSPNYLLTGLAVGIATLFHASNVYGAYKTAEYFNQNQENHRVQEWEAEVFRRPLPGLTLGTR